MVGLTLLDRARQSGLTVWGEDELLFVRGPRQQERLARALLDHKADVLDELQLEARLEEAWENGVTLSPDLFRIRTINDLFLDDGCAPSWPCYACTSTRWWRLKPGGRVLAGGPWVCGVCHPPVPPASEIEWAGGEA